MQRFVLVVNNTGVWSYNVHRLSARLLYAIYDDSTKKIRKWRKSVNGTMSILLIKHGIWRFQEIIRIQRCWSTYRNNNIICYQNVRLRVILSKSFNQNNGQRYLNDISIFNPFCSFWTLAITWNTWPDIWNCWRIVLATSWSQLWMQPESYSSYFNQIKASIGYGNWWRARTW